MNDNKNIFNFLVERMDDRGYEVEIQLSRREADAKKAEVIKRSILSFIKGDKLVVWYERRSIHSLFYNFNDLRKIKEQFRSWKDKLGVMLESDREIYQKRSISWDSYEYALTEDYEFRRGRGAIDHLTLIEQKYHGLFRKFNLSKIDVNLFVDEERTKLSDEMLKNNSLSENYFELYFSFIYHNSECRKRIDSNEGCECHESDKLFKARILGKNDYKVILDGFVENVKRINKNEVKVVLPSTRKFTVYGLKKELRKDRSIVSGSLNKNLAQSHKEKSKESGIKWGSANKIYYSSDFLEWIHFDVFDIKDESGRVLGENHDFSYDNLPVSLNFTFRVLDVIRFNYRLYSKIGLYYHELKFINVLSFMSWWEIGDIRTDDCKIETTINLPLSLSVEK